MHTLYSMQDSGNCYKLRLVMAQLGIPFRVEDIDILKGESRTPEFLEISLVKNGDPITNILHVRQ